MKIYTSKNEEAKDNIEMLLEHQELKNLINTLAKFEDEIKEFKTKNQDKNDLGFTHLHLKDYGLINEDSKSDIVLYVDLNNK